MGKRQYKGLELDYDENNELTVIGEAKFAVFGQMSDGMLCYHKVVDGEEIEGVWYSRFRKFGKTFFIPEGVE